MKHFIGGSALGFLASLILLRYPKRCTEMSDLEFCMFLFAHALFAFLAGAIAWGLLP